MSIAYIIKSTPIRPYSEEDYPYEFHLGQIIDKEVTHFALAWCQEQEFIDPEFDFKYAKAKDHKIHPPSEEDLKLLEPYMPWHTLKRKSLGHFFYFKRQQDYILFKLSVPKAG